MRVCVSVCMCMFVRECFNLLFIIFSCLLCDILMSQASGVLPVCWMAIHQKCWWLISWTFLSLLKLETSIRLRSCSDIFIRLLWLLPLLHFLFNISEAHVHTRTHTQSYKRAHTQTFLFFHTLFLSLFPRSLINSTSLSSLPSLSILIFNSFVRQMKLWLSASQV